MSANPDAVESPNATRRDFLYIMTGAVGAAAVVAVAWPLIDQMEPDRSTLAAGGPVEVDLTKLAPGQQIMAQWRSKPVFIVNRTPDALKTLRDAKLLDQLADPNSQQNQQPPYADNWHRSAKPEYLVLVGICTHLGCIPKFYPQPSATDPTWNWLGGYFCPCHGSKYDLAGRVFRGVPARYNLPVPPTTIVKNMQLRVGGKPGGGDLGLRIDPAGLIGAGLFYGSSLELRQRAVRRLTTWEKMTLTAQRGYGEFGLLHVQK
jgi:ubiquinol-cytochrome c reductase iron-sulfur subunit